MHGFSENYLKVSRPWNPNAINSISTVTLGKLSGEMIYSAE
jgi:hypothetical protein